MSFESPEHTPERASFLTSLPTEAASFLLPFEYMRRVKEELLSLQKSSLTPKRAPSSRAVAPSNLAEAPSNLAVAPSSRAVAPSNLAVAPSNLQVDYRELTCFVEFMLKRQTKYLERRGLAIPETTLSALKELHADISLPLSSDQINLSLSTKKYTNCYRFLDKTSQYLLNIILKFQQENTLDPLKQAVTLYLFKLFNSIETWERLQTALPALPEQPALQTALPALPEQLKTDKANTHINASVHVNTLITAVYDWAQEETRQNHKLFNDAYMLGMPTGYGTWLNMYSAALQGLIESGDLLRVRLEPHLLERNYYIFRRYDGFGPFLSYQFALDFSYFSTTPVDYDTFIVPGPGCRKGLRYVFPHLKPAQMSAVLQAMTKVGLHTVGFPRLNGLCLRGNDVQNLFCEYSKLRSGRGRAFEPAAHGLLPAPRVPASLL